MSPSLLKPCEFTCGLLYSGPISMERKVNSAEGILQPRVIFLEELEPVLILLKKLDWIYNLLKYLNVWEKINEHVIKTVRNSR